jgi:transposase
MTKIATVGLDIAKDVFQVHGVDKNGVVVTRRKLRRNEVLDYFKKLKPCLIGIEACASSHHWARSFIALGHNVKLIAPSFVRPFVKSQKNDAADAEAICEAIGRPGMRFVSVKSAEQQGVLTVHTTRALLIRQRTMLINAFRGHIAEYGEVARLGRLGVDALLALVEGDKSGFIPAMARGALRMLAKEIRLITEKAKALEAEIEAWHRANPQSRRLATIPGIGPLTASAMAAAFPDPTVFKSGKGLAASLGLVPRQYSTGGKPRLGGITKRGNGYIRKLLVFGAGTVLALFKRGKVTVPQSIARLAAHRPFKVAAVALANKMARIAWALLAKNESYRAPLPLMTGA